MPIAVQLALLLLTQAAPTNPTATLAVPVVPSCRSGRDSDDITVCGRRGEGGGYRVPQPDGFDPGSTVDSVSRERHRLLDVGGVGTQSCSAVGPGGWTGCEFNEWRRADEQWAGRNHGNWPRASVHVGSISRPPPR